jgi:hypothetical protein
MSDADNSKRDPTVAASAQYTAHGDILRSSRAPFGVAAIAILALLVLAVLSTATINGHPMLDLPLQLMFYTVIGLLVVSIFSVYIGYRLVRGSGVTENVVIPQRGYELLAPLISDGKAESIDQYVRLSSLTKFTGTFTKLGLSGAASSDNIFDPILFSCRDISTSHLY